MKLSKRNYIIVTAVMVAMAVLCFRAFYFPPGEMVKRRIVFYAGLVMLIVVVPFVICRVAALNRMVDRCIERTLSAVGKMRADWKRYGIITGIIVAGAVLMYPLTVGICKVTSSSMNSHRYMIVLAVYAILCVCFLYRKTAYERADRFAFLIIAIMGLCAILVTPSIPGTVPDDETHYRRTMEVIGFFTGTIYDAEEQTIREYVGNVQQHLYYDEESQGAYLQSLDTSYQQDKVIMYDVSMLSYYHIPYFVPACGIMLGRALGLSFAHTFMLGKFFICLVYAALISASIRQVRSGKAVFMAVGMIPSMVFLASAFNYDYWIVGWTMLGFAKYVALYENDDPITNRQIFEIILAIGLGIMPKIVYFPLFFPLLFLPKERLNKRQKMVLNACAVMVVVGICMVLLLPILKNNGAYSDTRGEGVVDTYSQLQYILADPLRYIRLLLAFGKGYFSMSFLGEELQFLYYVGRGSFGGVAMVTLVLAAFLDRDEENRMSIPVRLSIIIAVIGGYVLIATAMYLGFTEVGCDTILGVQSRYAYPLLVPFLYGIAPNKVRLTGKKENWMIVLALVMSLPMIWNLNVLSVSLF